ncbi:hypothetical protein GH811_02680 [Acetobacterium malicum]|uniref:Uncharacterized protein n=1 Tax=Acetobacterium malicum TaxID=52692 RepID=A0ABR6YTS8_9FIRM|nr:hypothetical protein [Acetobacterium malicum]MBC3898522.1 hypothetical protein [Acetobacterium malicum]
MLQNISHTLDRKSIRSGKPIVLETVIQDNDNSELDQNYLELIKLLDCVLNKAE